MSQSFTKPANFVLCHASASCPLAATCLRSKAWEELEPIDQEAIALTVVNLRNTAVHPLTEQCDFYRKTDKITWAAVARSTEGKREKLRRGRRVRRLGA